MARCRSTRSTWRRSLRSPTSTARIRAEDTATPKKHWSSTTAWCPGTASANAPPPYAVEELATTTVTTDSSATISTPYRSAAQVRNGISR